jgi:outer membrane protein OmpA-like peptidoglycan-associated protein
MKNIIIKKLLLIMIAILSALHIQAASLINESLLKNVNTDGDETTCAVTGNRKFFIFSRKLKGSDSGDLYFTEFKNGKWTEIKAAADLNSDSDETSPYISPDGKFILFSSDRPGGLKSSNADNPSYDIYYSEKKEGGWEKPELLFGAVNTTDDEFNPYITKEGNILYFTRSQFDDSSKTTIVKVNYKDDSWEDVSTAEISKNPVVDVYMYKKSLYKPGAYLTGFKKGDLTNREVFYSADSVNNISLLTGSPDSINTSGDEISVTELGKDSIVISSNTSGISGSYDFFIKKIIPEAKKETPKNLTLKVEAENYTSTDGIKIKILFFSSLKKNSWPVKTELKSPDQSGMINITADPGIKRVLALPGDSGMKSFSVEFLTHNESITTSTIKVERSEEKIFTIKPVYFTFNSSEIPITDIPYLHDLIDHLRQNKNAKLLLEGYSDGIGSYKANLDISVRRAERIKDYLVKEGIKKSRIKTKGTGYIKDKTADTSQYNRRVETNIILQ